MYKKHYILVVLVLYCPDGFLNREIWLNIMDNLNSIRKVLSFTLSEYMESCFSLNIKLAGGDTWNAEAT